MAGNVMSYSREFVVSLVIGVCLMAVGLACLFKPHTLQTYVLKNSTNRLTRINPFLNWMRTAQYVWSLRIIGLIAIAGSVLIIMAILSIGKE